MTMRTPKAEQEYQTAIKNKDLHRLFDEEPLAEYKHWVIVKNRFPHDKISTTNDMLVLRRECATLRHIKMHEWYELLTIIWEIRDRYDCIMYNFPGMSSVKSIPHAHLYRLTDDLAR